MKAVVFIGMMLLMAFTCIEGGLVAKSIGTMPNRCGDVHKGRAEENYYVAISDKK